MYNYLRPIDNRFQINGIAMPRPNSFKTNRKWNNLDASRDINTGELILNPINRIYETTWTYKLLRDDQFDIIYNQVFQQSKDNYKKQFQTLDTNTFKLLSYITYEQDNFDSPEITNVKSDGHRYYKNITFNFTSVGEATET